MSNKQSILRDAVNAKFDNVYMTSKSEVIETYKDMYGAKGWTRAISEKIHAMGLLTNKKGEVVSVKNIMRRFQSERSGKGEGRSADLYRTLGRQLPPIGRTLPGNSLTITIQGVQGGKKQRDREWTTTFTGPAAYAFAANPTYRAIWKNLNYPKHVIDMLDGGPERTTAQPSGRGPGPGRAGAQPSRGYGGGWSEGGGGDGGSDSGGWSGGGGGGDQGEDEDEDEDQDRDTGSYDDSLEDDPYGYDEGGEDNEYAVDIGSAA